MAPELLVMVAAFVSALVAAFVLDRAAARRAEERAAEERQRHAEWMRAIAELATAASAHGITGPAPAARGPLPANVVPSVTNNATTAAIAPTIAITPSRRCDPVADEDSQETAMWERTVVSAGQDRPAGEREPECGRGAAYHAELPEADRPTD